VREKTDTGQLSHRHSNYRRSVNEANYFLSKLTLILLADC